jgi:hypothetical protein
MATASQKRKGRPAKNLLEVKNKGLIGIVRLENNGITITVTETEAILSRMHAVTIYYIGSSAYEYLKALVELEIQEEKTEEDKIVIDNLSWGINAFVFSDGYAGNPDYLGNALRWHYEYLTKYLEELQPTEENSNDLGEMALNEFAIESMEKATPTSK